MKIRKLYSGANAKRTATSGELLSQYVFSNGLPIKFKPKLYMRGDYAYIVEPSGMITIYQCLKSGEYDKVDLYNWRVADLETLIQDCIDRAFGNQSLDYRVDFDYNVYKTGELETSIKRIMLPIGIDEYTKFWLFLDGSYVSLDLEEYKIIKDKCISYIETDREFADFVLYTIKPKNQNSRIISFNDMRPSSVTEEEGIIHVYIPAEVLGDNYAMLLYVNGKYVSEFTSEYDEETDTIILLLDPEAEITTVSKYDYTIATIVSRSEYIKIYSFSQNAMIISNIDRYRMELPCPQTDGLLPLIFDNGKPIPNDVLSIRDTVISVMDEAYYANIGDVIDASHMIFVVEKDAPTENASIVVNEFERHIPIPIINYNDAKTDVLVFRNTGTLLSNSRYYVHDGSIHLYEHETSVKGGETLQFQLFNKDESVAVRSTIFSVRADKTVIVPTVIDEVLKNSQFLLFRTDGTYISKEKYTVDGEILTFTEDTDISYGDKVEFVYNYYAEDITNTLTKVITTKVRVENQFILPFRTYQPDTDSVILFNGTTGLFINKDNYVVEKDGVVNITGGTTVSEGDVIDVYVLRNLKSSVYTDMVDKLLETI